MEAQKFNRLIKKIKYDKKAIEAIYEEFNLKLKVHIQRRFGKLVCAEDIAHEVFVKLLSLEMKEDVKYPTAWLFMIADNKVKDVLRSTYDEIALSELFRSPFNLDDTIVSADIKNAFIHLDAKAQQILYLHIWEGYTYKEIAQELGLGYANVRTKACRAMKTLKKYL